MKKNTSKKFLSIMLCVTTVLVGCSKSSAQVDMDFNGNVNPVPPSIGIVTDIGGITDHSFNQSAWEGLLKSQKDLGTKASYIETKDIKDYIKNLESMSNGKNALVWGEAL